MGGSKTQNAFLNRPDYIVYTGCPPKIDAEPEDRLSESEPPAFDCGRLVVICFSYFFLVNNALIAAISES